METSSVKYNGFVDSEFSSLHRISRLVPDGTTVLDVGCATGYLGGLLQPKGCTLFGVEGNEAAAAQALQRYVQVFVLDLDAYGGLPERQGPFDVIIFGDVLEHLKDPWRVLADMKPLVADGGRVIVSLPNVSNWSMRFHLLRGKFDYVDYGVLDSSHLRFFNLRTGRALLEGAGFEVIQTDFTPGVDKLVPYRLLVQSWLKGYAWYRRFEYRLTCRFPSLFAHQMIFTARPVAARGAG
jgi:methionine biosynthesis protein MetW